MGRGAVEMWAAWVVLRRDQGRPRRRYGELDQVMRAFTGQPADDTPQRPGQALTAYLRHTWHTRPWALAVAER